jgi:hypothetical protein
MSKVIDFGKSTTMINMVVTSDDGKGNIHVLYQQGVRYQLPRPCPVGVQAKARTQAVVQLLQTATLQLMAACGVTAAPVPDQVVDDDPNQEGTHDPEAFTEA